MIYFYSPDSPIWLAAGIACTQFPEGATDLISGAGARFFAISDPTRLYPIAEPFGALENNPTGIFEPNMKTGSLVTSFVNTYFQNPRPAFQFLACHQARAALSSQTGRITMTILQIQ